MKAEESTHACNCAAEQRANIVAAVKSQTYIDNTQWPPRLAGLGFWVTTSNAVDHIQMKGMRCEQPDRRQTEPAAFDSFESSWLFCSEKFPSKCKVFIHKARQIPLTHPLSSCCRHNQLIRFVQRAISHYSLLTLRPRLRFPCHTRHH